MKLNFTSVFLSDNPQESLNHRGSRERFRSRNRWIGQDRVPRAEEEIRTFGRDDTMVAVSRTIPRELTISKELSSGKATAAGNEICLIESRRPSAIPISIFTLGNALDTRKIYRYHWAADTLLRSERRKRYIAAARKREADWNVYAIFFFFELDVRSEIGFLDSTIRSCSYERFRLVVPHLVIDYY